MLQSQLFASQSHDTVAGSWRGVLDVGVARLTIVFHIEIDDEGGNPDFTVLEPPGLNHLFQ